MLAHLLSVKKRYILISIFSNSYVSVSRVTAVWESLLGVGDGARLLQEMGLPHRPHQRIRLQDLALAIEEECRPSSTPTNPMTTHQIAIGTVLHEMKALRFVSKASIFQL